MTRLWPRQKSYWRSNTVGIVDERVTKGRAYERWKESHAKRKEVPRLRTQHVGACMSVMALDLGEKRTGIAVSDAAMRVSLPITTLPTNEVLHKATSFRRLLEDHDIELLIVGLPLSLDGKEHAQAKRIRQQAKSLEQLYGLPIEFLDERLSSAEAKQVLRQLGYSEKEMRKRTDTIAAGLLLETWLAKKSCRE